MIVLFFRLIGKQACFDLLQLHFPQEYMQGQPELLEAYFKHNYRRLRALEDKYHVTVAVDRRDNVLQIVDPAPRESDPAGKSAALRAFEEVKADAESKRFGGEWATTQRPQQQHQQPPQQQAPRPRSPIPDIPMQPFVVQDVRFFKYYSRSHSVSLFHTNLKLN